MYRPRSLMLKNICFRSTLRLFSIKRLTGMAQLYRNLHSAAKISASDCKALMDETIDIMVSGLKPKQKVTLVGCLKEDRAEFVSHAHFESDNTGKILVKDVPSLGGSYTGIDKMGLFWSMRPSKNLKRGVRLYKKDVTKPYVVNLSVLDGFHQVETLLSDNESVLCCCDVERWYLDQNVERKPIREGRIRGTLFIPKGEGPFPGVIDLFGTAGGCIEFRAALLASRGICAFALAFFDYEDLPSGVDFDYDYFDEAIEWMISQPFIMNKQLGVMGVSKGAEIALHMACYNTSVKACVAIGGLPYYSFGMHTYKGKEINCATFDVEKITYTEQGMGFAECNLTENSNGDLIPFEKSGHCELLLIQGDDDLNTGRNRTDEMGEILKQHSMSNFTILNYPGTGHLIEPPYTPVNSSVYHKMLGSIIAYGGNPVEHAIAQQDSWHKILKLFRKRLGSSNNHINSKL